MMLHSEKTGKTDLLPSKMIFKAKASHKITIIILMNKRHHILIKEHTSRGCPTVHPLTLNFYINIHILFISYKPKYL